MVPHRPAIHSEQPAFRLENQRTDPDVYFSPRLEVLDATFESENERGRATGNASPSPAEPHTSSEELSRTKTNAEEKTRRFPRFTLSLAGRPAKPKQPGQSAPAVVSCALY